MNNVAPLDIVILGTISATDGSITGVTTGTSQPYRRTGAGIATIYFESVGTTSGGTLLIEEARVSAAGGYGGTWSQIASVAASSFTGTAQLAYHIANCAYGAIRVRISSDITGSGTVIVYLVTQGAGG